MVVGQFGSFIPGFLSSWTDSIEEGDCFITNDPYACKYVLSASCKPLTQHCRSSAISHLNDVLIVRPVYFEGELVSWSANLGHFTDVGSSVPGSMPSEPSACTCIYVVIIALQMDHKAYFQMAYKFHSVSFIVPMSQTRQSSRFWNAIAENPTSREVTSRHLSLLPQSLQHGFKHCANALAQEFMPKLSRNSSRGVKWPSGP